MKIEPQVVEADNILMAVNGKQTELQQLMQRLSDIPVEIKSETKKLEKLQRKDTYNMSVINATKTIHAIEDTEEIINKLNNQLPIIKSQIAKIKNQLSELLSKATKAKQTKDAAIKKQKQSETQNPETSSASGYATKGMEQKPNVRPLTDEEIKTGYGNMGINPETGRSTDFEKKQQQYAGMESVQKMQVRSGKPKAKSQDEQYEYDKYGVRIPKNKKQPTQQNTGYQRTR